MSHSVNTAGLKTSEGVVSKKARALHAVWNELRRDRLAPRRDEITLARLRNIAPWVWTVEVLGEGADYRFRMGGQKIVEFMGGPHTGQLLSNMPNTAYFARMRAMFSHCVQQKCPVAAGPWASVRENKDHLETEVLVLPLSENGETVTGLIGLMDMRPLAPSDR